MRIGKGGIADIYTNEQLMQVDIVENGERLVNVRDYSERFLIEIEEVSRKMQNLSVDACFLRATAAKMLAEAQALLANGRRFKIIDGYRPMAAQQRIHRELAEQIQKEHPDWSPEQVITETDRWVANPKVVPPHTTGGAVDLTIVGYDGTELDMGTLINTSDEASYTMSDRITNKAKANRELLIKTLAGAGFVNNPREWWHWSYGDRRWAITMGASAIYGSI